MTSSNDYIAAAQEWSVRFKDKGKNLFQSLGGSEHLCDWHFRVTVPKQEGRTEKELVEEVRTLAIDSIYKKCQKDGLDISIDDLNQLNSNEYLEGSMK